MVDNIFFQLSVLMGITVSIAFIMRLLRQPLIVAYIIAGLIGGPLFLNLVNGGEEFFKAFAQFGIVLLLFIVGLSLNFDYIKKMGKSIFIGSLLQFSLTSSVGYLIMRLLNFSSLSSIFIAIAISFSSTIIVIKLLSDKKDIEAVYGRYIVGVLLVQDIIAITIMIFLNTSQFNNGSLHNTILLVLGKGALLIISVWLMSKYLLPIIIDKIAKSGELLFIFTIAWCFGIASLVYWVGFSIEIGAIIAGISLGSSVYQAEISSRIRPLRDFFIVLFFIVLGSELQLGDLRQAIIPGLILSIFVLIADPLILYFSIRKVGYTKRNAFLAAITAAQVSEFGFILIFKGLELKYLQGIELAILTIVALITIIISSYLITYNEQIYRYIRPLLNKIGQDKEKDKQNKTKKEIYDVWVFGYHRIGWKVCETLIEKKVKFAVVDFNPDIFPKLKRRNIPAYFGDAADIEFLESLPLEKAKLIISTLPEVDDQKVLITHIRHLTKKTKIIANLYDANYLEELYKAGANYVMMPHLLGGQWVSMIIKNYPWTIKTFAKLKKTQKEEMNLRFSSGIY